MNDRSNIRRTTDLPGVKSSQGQIGNELKIGEFRKSMYKREANEIVFINDEQYIFLFIFFCKCLPMESSSHNYSKTERKYLRHGYLEDRLLENYILANKHLPSCLHTS